MGCCGYCKELMREINGRELFEEYYIEENKNPDYIDNKEDNKKQFVKINNNDENPTNKMSEKIDNRNIGVVAQPPTEQKKINNNTKNNNDTKNNNKTKNNNNKMNNNKINNTINNNISNNSINNNINNEIDELIINKLIGNKFNKPVVKEEIKNNLDLNYNKNFIEPKVPINYRDIYDNPYKNFQLRPKYDNLFDNLFKNNDSLNKKNIFDNNEDIMDGPDDINDGADDITGNYKKNFYDLDTNLDNLVNKQEFMDGYNIPSNQAEQFIQNYDENGDGCLDKNEYDQIPSYDFGFM